MDKTIEELEQSVARFENEETLLELGELYYAAGESIKALNIFNRVLRMNPQNRKARNYATMIMSVLNFYNKDLLNP